MSARVIVEERHDLPLVHFQVILPRGSASDPLGRDGTMRLAARMLRRGAGKLSARELDERIDALGAEIGIETSPSHVRLAGSVIRRNLEPALELLGQMLHEPGFAESELELLRRETLAALVELTDSDPSLASMHFRRVLFQGHPFGRRSLGNTETLSPITIDDIRRTYREHLALPPFIVGFAGDVTRAEAERLSRLHLDAGDRPAVTRTILPEPTARAGRHLRVVDKPERSQTQIQIGALGSHPHDPDHLALHVGNAAFGGAFTARLMKAVRSERGWSYGASSRLAIDRVREAWSMWTFPAATDAVPCIELELALMEAWVKDGIDDEELAFSKSYLIKSHAFSSDTADKRLEQQIEIALFDLPDDYFSAYPTHIAAITREQVHAAVTRRLSPENLVLSVVATESELGSALRGLPGLTSYEVVPFDVL